MDEKQDPRVHEDICGVTMFTEHFEWICIRPVHAKVYKRKSSSGRHKKGDIRYDVNPQADRHHMVNRWPNRPH